MSQFRPWGLSPALFFGLFIMRYALCIYAILALRSFSENGLPVNICLISLIIINVFEWGFLLGQYLERDK